MNWFRKSASTKSTIVFNQTRFNQFSTIGISDLYTEFTSSIEGLEEEEARKLLNRYGLNEVAKEQQKRWYNYLFLAFNTPFNILLSVIAAISYFTSDIKTVVVLCLMISLSSLLSFFQEFRSNQAAQKLKALVGTKTLVKRKTNADSTDDKPKEIAIAKLVPGDIVYLSAGDMVPADLRIISAKDLFVNQATLTGESFPVERSDTPPAQASTSPLDTPNICFMGSNIVSGTATAIVIFTGQHSYLGAFAQNLSQEKIETDFDKGIKSFSKLLIQFMLIMVPAVFLINGLMKGNWMEAFLFAIAVAVGLIPEMLPMIVVANLSRGAVNMSKKKVIVKKLSAIQNFGSINILCTDKTGTLTQDKIVLIKHVDVEGADSDEVLKHAYLNSHFQTGLKNLLDVSILEHVELGKELKISTDYTKVDEIPFDFNRRRMSVIIDEKKHHHELICKGAIEEIFAICTQVLIQGTVQALQQSLKEKIIQYATSLNEDGLRVIAIAYKETTDAPKKYTKEDEKELTLLGFVAFLDPPKESAAPAIEALNTAGINVKILTGDNEIITRKVCHAVGIPTTKIILGTEIESLNDLDLQQVASDNNVFAKLNPMQKERIVKALRAKGYVVGFMGDGINDAPALKVADIGISVDTAVDISKESADIILLEKSLMVLRDGVIEGRKTFGNTLKYIKMSASSNFGNMFSMIGASAFLPFLPLLPLQILGQNLLYDISQTAIPFDHVDEEYTLKPIHWDMDRIRKFMFIMGPISSLFDYITFGILWFVFHANTIGMQSLFQTGWFIEGLLTQVIIVHIIRTAKIPFFQSTGSIQLLITTALVISIGLIIVNTSIGEYLNFTPLPSSYFCWLVGIIFMYGIITQYIKKWFVKRYGFN